MTTNNALVFFLVGLGMLFAPAELPQFFPGDAVDGSNTSALWLGLMGLIQSVLGLAVAMHNETIRLRAAIEAWEPLDRTFDHAQVRWSMPASLYARVGDWRQGELAAAA
jgi:hypothetical protein